MTVFPYFEDETSLNQWLSAQIRELDLSIGRALDVESGLHDAKDLGEPTRLNKAIATLVDVEAGLEAIVPRPEPVSAISPTISEVAAYAERLMASPWQRRLEVRIRLPRQELEEVRFAALKHDLDRAIDHSERIVGKVVQAVQCAQSLSHEIPISEFATEIEELLEGARRTARQIKNTLTHGARLWRTRAHLLVLTGHLKHSQSLTNGLADRITVEDIGHLSREQLSQGFLNHNILTKTLNEVLDLADQLSGELARLCNLERTLAAAHSRARPNPELADALNSDMHHGREHGFNRALTMALASGIENITQATTNFTGADLTTFDLHGVPLAGIRWSPTTRWPDNWTTLIQLTSIEVSPDLFEIREDPRLNTHATT
ncbi:hypothetical protein SAMN04489729_7962 [Amycolatopsis lurida]|uniref:hypothetical protein n=1 Tax=Amycolatopsis lurida TaxID=31959 RepID=UPI0008951B33|nr:hypothetical protein [Amycolatopsis lurida]SEE53902.1 hypothetical protein SAMN04489729_7962 [Amycolatopsis lurida]